MSNFNIYAMICYVIRKGDTMKMLEVKNLSKSFNKISIQKKKKIYSSIKAVDDISFEVSKGEIVGILGPNGAGKTTLLRMIAGMMETETGEVIVAGLNQKDGKEIIKKEYAYLSNNTKIYGRFSARELLKLFGEIYGLDNTTIKENIRNIIDLLDLESFVDNNISSLSTGQYQRVNIARCIIHNPKLYILDEPTLGLDVIGSKDIIDFMLREKSNGKSILYSTHYMEEAEYLCDRIIMIYKGRKLVEGKVKDLKLEYQVESIRDLFFKLVNDMEAL